MTNRTNLRRLVASRAFAPQSLQIASHLVEVKSISGIEAAAMFKCRSLPRRIKDIRDAGVEVSSAIKHDTTGQRYVRYTLE